MVFCQFHLHHYRSGVFQRVDKCRPECLARVGGQPSHAPEEATSGRLSSRVFTLKGWLGIEKLLSQAHHAKVFPGLTFPMTRGNVVGML